MSRSSGPNAALSDGIQTLTKSNAKLERMLAKIGTQADTSDFRDKMHSEQTASTQQVKHVMTLLKQMSRDGTAGSSVVQRLSSQFDREFKRFQALNNSMDAKQVRVIDAVKTQRKYSSSQGGAGQGGYTGAAQYDEEDPLNSSSQRVYDEPPAQQSQQQQAELDIQFIEYDVEELEKRQREIGAIEQSVLEVSEMYRDLQSLVHEQQEHIDLIDSAIVQTKERTEQGHNELLLAEDYQKKSRKKKCCMLFLVLGVLAVVVVIIFLAK